MTKKKKKASISLDLDNQWSYMKIHGDNGWEDYPSYLNIFVPHILKVLDELNLKITFFIVGQDAVLKKNQKFLKMITDHGHEVGNHSFHHESWIHKYTKEQLREELRSAEDAIVFATGEKPVGFRGPGFSWSKELLEVLNEMEYIYDASTLPTWIGPLARRYYFMTASLSKEEKKNRDDLFGNFSDGRRPVKPYSWKINDVKTILEIPVTTIPVLRIPFHLSYLLFLSGISKFLMRIYLKMAVFFCKITNTQPSFLLHPLDLIGGDQITQLTFFPGMNISSDKKVDVFKTVFSELSKHFELVNMSNHATYLSQNKNLKEKLL
ncbi:polysaccharide deacetylase family protein [Saccharicrinis sp. FJH54]|uniref:polysaccharide deacetylase family protein n=1 Tax=Saccharicrinis sp. FJH54 TaxID=3344665 RepID=UPI0035D48343